MKTLSSTYKVRIMVSLIEIMIIIGTVKYLIHVDWAGMLFSLGLFIIFLPTKENVEFFQQKAFIKLKLNKVHMAGLTLLLSSAAAWLITGFN